MMPARERCTRRKSLQSETYARLVAGTQCVREKLSNRFLFIGGKRRQAGWLVSDNMKHFLVFLGLIELQGRS
jgi:hypothetical protein